ncbi:MAG TPA: hypothetical protein VK206_22895 [Anaerolineales bacterium]|nr:hypothetical protein [Anaerolineales bacterium]
MSRIRKFTFSGSTDLFRYSLLCLIVVVSFARSYLIAGAAGQDVYLEIFPPVLRLDPNKPADVVVVLRNPTSDLLQNIQVHSYTDLNIDLSIDPYEDAQVPPGGSLSLNVHITQKADESLVGKLYFQFNYTQVPLDNSSSLPSVVVGTLEIQGMPLDSVEQVAQVQLQTALDQIEEQRPGQIFLVIHNLSNVPITIDNIAPYGPGFITISIENFNAGFVLAPQSNKTYVVNITAKDSVQTGPQRLLFEVGITWIKSGHTNSGSLLATQTINTAIIGESDLLKLLGIPSFLFLPGFLILTTFVTLWKRVFPKSTTNLDFSPPEFALISITLSLITAAAYPRITGLFSNEPRNYLQAYGLRDVFQVWFGSVAFGALVWIAWSGGLSLRDKYREFQKIKLQKKLEAEQEARLALLTPKETDTPSQILEKMARNDIKLPLLEAKIKIGGRTPVCFIVLPANTDQSPVWVTPPIQLIPLAGLNLEDEQYQAQKQKFRGQIQAAKHSKELRDVLNEATVIWNVVWGKEGPITGPTPIPQTSVDTPRTSQRYFVEQE